MADLFLLSEAQMRRIERFFPLSHGIPRVDDRRIISGIVFVIKNGLRWRIQQDFCGTGAQGWQASTTDDRYDPSEGAPHRCQSFKKGSVPRRIGRTKGGLNSKLHAVCDGQGRPLIMLLSEGQMSDYKARKKKSLPTWSHPHMALNGA